MKYLGRQTETCCHPHCTPRRRPSAGTCPCETHSLAENCTETKSQDLRFFCFFFTVKQELDQRSVTHCERMRLHSPWEKLEPRHRPCSLWKTQQRQFIIPAVENVLIYSFWKTNFGISLILGCLTSVSMWAKLLLLFRVDEAVASRIWVRISLWSTSCVSGWVSTAKRTIKTWWRWSDYWKVLR